MVVSLVVMLAYRKVAMMAAHLVVQMVYRTAAWTAYYLAAWTAYYLAAVRVGDLVVSLVVLSVYQKVAMMAAHWVVQMVF